MPSKAITITLKLDALDHEAVMQAIAYRSQHVLPSGGGSKASRALAEVCRGWLDMMGQWQWPGNPKPKPTREVREQGGRKRALRVRKKASDRSLDEPAAAPQTKE